MWLCIVRKTIEERTYSTLLLLLSFKRKASWEREESNTFGGLEKKPAWVTIITVGHNFSHDTEANKTGTSKVGAISKAQKAQSFLNMPRMYSWKALKTLSRHPKCALHARYDWKITFPDSTENKKKFENFFEKIFFEKIFLKKLRKRRIVPKNEKGGPFGIH